MPNDIAVCTKCGQPTWRTRCAYCKPADFKWEAAATRLLKMVARGDPRILEEQFKDLAVEALKEYRRVQAASKPTRLG